MGVKPKLSVYPRKTDVFYITHLGKTYPEKQGKYEFKEELARFNGTLNVLIQEKSFRDHSQKYRNTVFVVDRFVNSS